MQNPERESLRDKLVPVESNGLGPCVDGRLARKKGLFRPKLRGPKIQGGVLGVAALDESKTTADIIGEEEIRLACRKYKNAGFLPSVHGDKKHGKRGCGFGRLWIDGELDDLSKLGISLERISEIVIEEGGIYVELEGEHAEKFVAVNYVANMTLEPDGSMFILDAWAANLFGIDQSRLLNNGIKVVQKLHKLHGPDKIIEIR